MKLENKRSFPNQLMQLIFPKPNHSQLDRIAKVGERGWSGFGFRENSDKEKENRRKFIHSYNWSVIGREGALQVSFGFYFRKILFSLPKLIDDVMGH